MTRHAWFLVALALVGCSGAVAPGGDGGDRDDGGLRTDSGATDAGPLADGGSGDAGAEGCSLPAAFDEGATYARTLHVATTGSASGDGSEGAPFDTIRAAMSAATPGTRVLVQAGTYVGSIWLEDVAGTASAPIAIIGEGEVVLDAAGAGEVMHVAQAEYLVIEGLTLQGSTANGLNIDDAASAATPSHHVVLRDLVVRDVGTGGNNDCIKLSGLDDYFVLGGDISGCDAGDAIDHVGCHRGLIRGVSFHDTPGGGIQMKGGSSDILVHGNTFVDVRGRSINAGGSTGLEFFRPIDATYEAARLSIVANVFVRSGAESGAPIAFVGCDACVFANNTIVDPQTWVARILQESTDARFVPSRDGLFVNNVVIFDAVDLRTFVNVGPGTAPETFTFANNLWYARDDASFSGPTLGGGIPAETGSVIQMDPGIDETSWDLCAGAPGWDAGRAVPGVCRDRWGDPYLSPPSIGADQADSCTL